MDKRDATTPQIPAALTLDLYRNNIDSSLEAIMRVKPAGERR